MMNLKTNSLNNASHVMDLSKARRLNVDTAAILLSKSLLQLSRIKNQTIDLILKQINSRCDEQNE
jgi:hypothetical protein